MIHHYLIPRPVLQVWTVLSLLAIAYGSWEDSRRGVDLVVFGATSFLVAFITRLAYGRTAIQDVADTYYDKGYRDGRKIGRPVVLPLNPCPECPLQRMEAHRGARTAQRARQVPGEVSAP